MAERLAEALEVDDFSGAEETGMDRRLRIFDNTENVVIGRAGFLLGSKVFKKVGNRVALGLELAGIKRNASGLA